MTTEAAAPSNLLTPSRMRTYRECSQKEAYEYLLGVRPIDEAEYFLFGRVWGICMEAGLRAAKEAGPTNAFVYEIFLAAAIDELDSVGGVDDYDKAKIRSGLKTVERIFREMAMLTIHEIVGVEVPFLFPHVNPATGRESPKWLRAGKIDAIFRHIKSGRLRVVEHKTTADQIGAADPYWKYLSLDTQISQYVLGVETTFQDLVVDEIIYDVMKKPGIRPLLATPVEKREFTKAKFKQCPECRKKKSDVKPPHKYTEDGVLCDGLMLGSTTLVPVEACEPDPEAPGVRRICTDRGGRLYANMRVDDESPKEYEARLDADAALDPSSRYAIQIVPRTEKQIESHLRDSWALAQQMLQDHNNGWAVKNPDACHRRGSACPYWEVCIGARSIDDPNYFRQLTSVHPELGETFLSDVAAVKQKK